MSFPPVPVGGKDCQAGCVFGRIPLLHVRRVWPTSDGVACQHGARAARTTAIAIQQSGALLVNGSCVVIQKELPTFPN